MAKAIATIEDLTPDTRNANRGTPRGRKAVEDSLRSYGAGRSIVVDREGRVIAGNKTLEAAADIDLPIRAIQTDGRELVVVQRTDLDLEDGGGDNRARMLAYADNRAGELGLDWDPEQLAADIEAGIDLSRLWGDEELAAVLATVADVEPPADFAEVGEDIETEHECPRCGYRWSGGA